jgi:hypothetical protein
MATRLDVGGARMDLIMFATIICFFITVIAIVAMAFGQQKALEKAIQALSEPLKTIFERRH